MHRLLTAALGLAAVVAAAGAQGDQNHPQLDELFSRLQTIEDPERADRVTRRIWRLWREVDDEAVAAAMERGARALAAGNHGLAAQIYTRVVERAPRYAEGWNKRATARYLMGEYARSAADIRRALALEPRHFGALAGLGLVYMEIDQDRAALEAFREALAINPHLEGTRANIELLRQRMGEGDA